MERLETFAKRAFAIGAIIKAGDAVIDYASKLTDLSQKTGMSTTGLQKLELAFKANGIEVETVAASATKLSRSLIEGDKSTVGALSKMGLAIADLKQMAPEQQFLTVADAIGKIPNPTERAWVAMQVFGKGGAELLAGLTGNLTETTAEFEKMGLIISEEAIKAADDFGDALGILFKQLMALLATVIVPILPLLQQLGTVLMWIGNNVIGPILNVAIKAALTLLAIFWERIAELLSGLAMLGSKLPYIGEQFRSLGEWLKQSSTKTGDYLSTIWTGSGKVAEAVPKATGALRGFAPANEKAANETKKLVEHLRELESVLPGLTKDVGGVVNKDLEWAQATLTLRQRLAELQRDIWSSVFGTKGLAEGLEHVGETVPPVTQELREHVAQIARMNEGYDLVGPTLEQAHGHLQSFGNFLKNDLGKIILGAFQGGGNIAKTIGAAIAGWFTDAQSSVGKGLADLFSGPIAGGLSKVFGQTIGKMLGSVLGSIIPGLGPLIGAALGKLASGIGKLFGSDEEAKMVNPARDKFFTQFGEGASGLANFHKKLVDALGPMGEFLTKQILMADTMEEFNAATKAAQEALAFQDQAMATLQETTERYGFTLDEIGPAMQRLSMDKTAQQLFKDWEVLNAAGIDTVTISNRMSASVNEYVHNALKMGIEVPEAMRPMLEKMVELGLLTDENGNIITDLEASGVKFAMTMSEGFKALIDEVKKLTDAIAQGLGIELPKTAKIATDSINRELSHLRTPIIRIPIEWSVPDIPMEWQRQASAIPMQHGGMGIVTQPTLFLAGEAGPEQFAFSGAGRRFGGGGSGSTSVIVNAQGAYFDSASIERLATQVGEAVMRQQRRERRLNAA